MSQETVDPSVLELIRKVHAKAESCKAIGSEAEAQTFAEAVQRMLAKHRLSMSDIQFNQFRENEPVGKSEVNWDEHGLKNKARRCQWIEQLANVVAQAHSCTILVRVGSNVIVLVGREHSRKIAEYALAVLVRAAESLAQRAYDKFYWECERDGRRYAAKGFREAFLKGFIQRIAQRYYDELYGNNAEQSTALVRFNQEKKDVEDWMEEQEFKKAPTMLKRRVGNDIGFVHGQQAANDLDLKGKAVEGGGMVKNLLGVDKEV